MGKYMHICNNCGNYFENYFEIANFCCKNCYHEYRRNNSKIKYVQCPICHDSFKQKRPEQIFCSVECRIKSTENKIQCTCEYCGKLFERKESEVIKNKHHYCSIDCRNNAMYWSDSDIEILKNNFGKLPYKDMVNLFFNTRTEAEIKRKAIYLGLTSSREWSKEEIDILLNKYSIKPISEVMELLPNRSKSSILGQARVQDIKSFFYLNHVYSQDENNYLIENYLNKSNEELSQYLHRTSKGIEQHLYILDLHRPTEIDSYKDLSSYIRCRLASWKETVRKESNYTCALTGVKSNIVVHHIVGFNLLMNETIDILNFPIYKNMSEYNQQQLDTFLETFLQVQEMYHSYICINEDVHKQFHNIYGYGNNTQDQWDDFVNKYYK